jgi:hypothetical protein
VSFGEVLQSMQMLKLQIWHSRICTGSGQAKWRDKVLECKASEHCAAQSTPITSGQLVGQHMQHHQKKIDPRIDLHVPRMHIPPWLTKKWSNCTAVIRLVAYEPTNCAISFFLIF